MYIFFSKLQDQFEHIFHFSFGLLQLQTFSNGFLKEILDVNPSRGKRGTILSNVFY